MLRVWRAAVWLVVAQALFAQSPVSFRYFYDDANELFRVVDSTGTMIEYVYDPAGNIIQINRTTVAAGALSILNVTPLSGAPGNTITILGQGFSTVAANNVVTMNGVAATVISATATQIVIQVPAGTISGQITVTVNGVTVSSGPTLVFNPLPPSVISGVSPASAAGGQNVTITVTGSNLLLASFYFANGFGLVTSATVNGDGSGATLQAALAGAVGTDNILAVNYLGTSVAAAGNQFTVLAPAVPAHGTAISGAAVSALNAIAEPNVRSATGPAVSALNGISGPNARVAAGQTVAALNAIADPNVRNTTSPKVAALNYVSTPGPRVTMEVLSALNWISAPGHAAAMSAWVSVQNGSASHNVLSTTAPAQAPATAARPSLSVARGSGALRTLQAMTGQTVALEVAGTEQAALLLNGAALDGPQGAGVRRFVVPAGLTAITATVRDGAADSEPVGIAVSAGGLRRLSGLMTLPDGSAAGNRDLEIRASGLSAEYFRWQTALTALPDLAGMKPDVAGFVSSLAMENPDGVFGTDPFGVALGPNYAARFTGAIRADAEGGYRFFVSGVAGARLSIDGQAVTGVAQLTAGWHAIEVEHFVNGGSPELRLEWERPGMARETVDPAHLTPARFWSARTDERGGFVISDFPAFLDPVEFRADCDGVCSMNMEQNQ